MIPKDFKQLLEEYQDGTMDAEQRAAFERLLHGSESEEQLKQLIDATLEDTTPVHASATSDYLYERIREEYIKEEVPVVRMNWWRYAAAAVLVVGVGLFFLLRDTKKEAPLVNNNKEQKDIAPGHDGAILTLADGKQVVLDSVANGVIANQNGATVVLKNGSLTYDKTGQTAGGVMYNTMHTPRGRQFQLILPDGSRVWLNAASSIKYPTVFNGTERRVEIDGEAYFEVVKNEKMPFRVVIDKTTEVEVLGTHFNINAYDNEPAARTTLLEGKVKVKSAILKPGQQAVLTSDAHLKIYDSVDLDQVMAWKNGLFNFNGYDIKSVMRELSRWYDLDIVYETDPEPTEVMGEMQRNLNLSQVMNILQKIGVRYRLDGRKLIVTEQGQ
jgi:transmembrane sensor